MQENDYILLLSKRFSGDLAPQEALALEAWLGNSPDHAALAQRLEEIWEKTGSYGAGLPIDLDADFRRLQARIRSTEAAPARRVALPSLWLRAAAALVVVLAAVWMFRIWTAPEPLRLVSVPAGEIREVTLPDGSHVWLRQHTTLEYPESFGKALREVRLNGEAYFEVVPSPDHPFRIQTVQGDQVDVLGTAFGLKWNAEQQRTEVVVRNGRVRFRPHSGSEAVELTARQKAVFDHASARLNLEKEVTLNDLAWQSGGLEFISTPLEKVVSDLEAYYQVKITLVNPDLLNCRHTAPLTNQPIQNVLEGLALTYKFKLTSPAPRHYELRGGNCR